MLIALFIILKLEVKLVWIVITPPAMGPHGEARSNGPQHYGIGLKWVGLLICVTPIGTQVYRTLLTTAGARCILQWKSTLPRPNLQGTSGDSLFLERRLPDMCVLLSN